MTEWKEYKLGEVIKTNVESIGKDYPYSKILYLDTGSITRNNIDQYQEFELDKAPSRAKRLVKQDDIIYSSVRPNQLHYGYITNPANNLVVSTGFVTITCNKAYIEPKFLYYYLTQENITEYLHSVAEASTSAYPSLKPSDIEFLDISLPPLPEQIRIASILSSLDDKIDLLHRENKTLEAMAETLFRQWFIEEAKEDWEEGKLGDICIYVTEKIDIGNVEIGDYISTENMCSNKQGVVKASSVPETGKVTKYRIDDILLSNIRPYFKKIWLADKEGGCSADVLCIRSKNELYKFFTYYMIRQDDFFDYVMLGSKGCKMPRGDKSHIMNWPIMIPSKDVLLNFNIIVANEIEKIRSNNKQIQTLIQQRDSLLPKLMSGEVKI